MAAFFTIEIADEERWHLTESCWDKSPFNVLACQEVNISDPIRFRIFQDGKRVDLDSTSFSTLVVSRRFADVVSSIAPNDVQRIPAIVDGDDGEWEVLNVITCLDCIDYHKSIITSYYPANHPDRPGKPRGVLYLVFDANRIGSHHIFRPKGWEVELVVSDTVKNALMEIGVTGVDFVPKKDDAERVLRVEGFSNVEFIKQVKQDGEAGVRTIIRHLDQ